LYEAKLEIRNSVPGLLFFSDIVFHCACTDDLAMIAGPSWRKMSLRGRSPPGGGYMRDFLKRLH